MPSNIGSHTLAVSEAAEAVGVTVHSLRRWCKWHAAHLSAKANPGPGQSRRLTGTDIEVLRHVKALRDEGLQTPAINEALTGLTFAEIDIEEQALAEPTAPLALDSTPALLMVVNDLRNEFDAKLAALGKAREPSYFVGFGMGFIAALLFVLVIVGLAVLYGGFR